MAQKNNSSRKRFIWDIRDDVWGLLKMEAVKEGRKTGKQLEKILELRYKPEQLSEEEIKEAIRLANENTKIARARSRKGSQKQSNGGKR